VHEYRCLFIYLTICNISISGILCHLFLFPKGKYPAACGGELHSGYIELAGVIIGVESAERSENGKFFRSFFCAL
jgi:hypothetical protein